MAYRKPITVSVPPPLEQEVKSLARKQHQTVSELVRAALRLYLTQAEREAAWKRTRAYGRKNAKTLGITTEAQLQAILDELRHNRDSSVDASSARRR